MQPTRVVGRAGADVPRVDVAAEQHDLLRPLAAANLADDVGRLDVGFEVRLPSSSRTRTRRPRAISRAIRSASSTAMAAAGIGVRPGPYCTLPVCGVRSPVGPDRSNEHGDRAELRRRTRAAGAIGHRVAVGRERRVEQHDAAA